jgi:hypothetical protein
MRRKIRLQILDRWTRTLLIKYLSSGIDGLFQSHMPEEYQLDCIKKLPAYIPRDESYNHAA